MSSTIKLKRSGNTGFKPDQTNISLGELFLNYQDGTLYFKDSNNRIFFLQATLMSYSFSTINVNGTLLNASQNNIKLDLTSDQSLILTPNVQLNSINISSNLVDSYMSTSLNQAPTCNALYSGLLVTYGAAQSAYAQANTAYSQANLATSIANSANASANGSLSSLNNQNANYTITINDADDTIYHNTSTAITYTLPTFAIAPIPLGKTIKVISGFGAGTITISPASGVSLWLANSATANGNQTISARIVGKLTHLEPNVWSLEKS